MPPAELAASLGNGHCFEVLHVFALPQAPEGIADSVAAFVVESGGARLGNGWFSGVALDALAAFLVRACVAGGGGLLRQAVRQGSATIPPDVPTRPARNRTVQWAASLRHPTPLQLGELSAGAIAETTSNCRKKKASIARVVKFGSTWKTARPQMRTRRWISGRRSSSGLASQRPSTSWHAPGPRSPNRTAAARTEFCASGGPR